MNRRWVAACGLSLIAVGVVAVAYMQRGPDGPIGSLAFESKNYRLSSPVDPAESAVFVVDIVNRGAKSASATLGSPCRCATYETIDGEPLADDEIALGPSERQSIRVRLAPTNKLGPNAKRIALAQNGAMLDSCELNFDGIPLFATHPKFLTLSSVKLGEPTSIKIPVIGRLPSDRLNTLNIVASSPDLIASIEPATNADPVEVDGVPMPVVAILDVRLTPSSSGSFHQVVVLRDASGKGCELAVSADVIGRGLTVTPGRLVIVDAGRRIEERTVFIRRWPGSDGEVGVNVARGVETQVRTNGSIAEVHLKVDMSIAREVEGFGITVTGGEHETAFLPIKIVRG